MPRKVGNAFADFLKVGGRGDPPTYAMLSVVQTQTMTLTERNQRLYDLRKRLAEAQLQVAWVETEILAVNQQYKDAQRGDLFQEMFGEPQTLWEHLDKI
jgi:hypothetical protein